MVNVEDLWKEKIDTNNPDKDKILKLKTIDKYNEEDEWNSDGSEGELNHYDFDNIGIEEEGDSEGELEEWESGYSSDDDGQEDLKKEMEKLTKVEQLQAILRRLMELRRQGEKDGINQKIAEVQMELRKHLRNEKLWKTL